MNETKTQPAAGRYPPAENNETFMETKTIGISGMTCDNCVKTIEKALRGKRGVEEVRVDRADATATVTFDRRETDLPELHEILLRSGYKPTGGVVP